MVGVLIPAGYEPGGTDAGEALAFLIDNQAMLYVWTLVIYIVFGCFLVVAAIALHQRLKPAAQALVTVATAFGIIWAAHVLASGMIRIIDLDVLNAVYATDPGQAEAAWLPVRSVEEGLGGVIEIVGGLWVLLVSLAGLRSTAIPRLLNYLGVVVGVAGVVTVLPALGEFATVFGLGAIIWFGWLGIVMLRQSDAQTQGSA